MTGLPQGLAQGLIFGCAAFAIVALVTPGLIRVARRLDIVDRPHPLKIHQYATPLMGGAGIAAGFFIAVVTWLAVQRDVVPNTALLGLLVGALLAVVLGFCDEKFTLRPGWHLTGQVAVVVAAMVAGFPHIERISNPLQAISIHQSGSLYLSALVGVASTGQGSDAAPALTMVMGVALTIFWIVGMMNTVNILDGLDGLAGGVTGLAAVFLAIWAIVVQQSGYAPTHDSQNVVLPLILAGAIGGFLVYNWTPAKIFMGDSGSMFIGFTIGALSIFGPIKLGTALLLLIIPIINVAWAIVRRLLSGRSPARGDTHHIFNRLVELGLSPRQVVLVFYTLCTVLGVIDVSLYKKQKLIAFALVTLCAAVAAVTIEIAARRQDVRKLL